MTPPWPTGLAHSIQARLKNAAQKSRRPFAEMLELYAVERLLHRLGRSRHRERFVLKGALLLRGWLGVDARPTRDVDLLGPAEMDADALREAIADILRADVEDDAIAFDDGSIAIQAIRVGSAVLGLRAKFDACLGKTRLRYQVDVGLGDAVYPPAVEVVPGGLLGMPMASVRAYTPYTSVAEKLEAIVVLGDANSRAKDYYDLLQLPRSLPFDGSLLAESIRRTFARRATVLPTEPPEGLSDRFARAPLHVTRWQAFLRKGVLRVAETGFSDVVAAIRRFAEPALDAACGALAFDRHWDPGGPWR
ncbi:MAG: nucleotidyl transferase AbiEii/AbiGii toxin family protein [Planctomycetes bacterium]|nr:nucleotidyl transferase AbiEii/AbiGii toxin family protein [Planctomycetota bacterium]